jgi:hypothetical protein
MSKFWKEIKPVIKLFCLLTLCLVMMEIVLCIFDWFGFLSLVKRLKNFNLPIWIIGGLIFATITSWFVVGLSWWVMELIIKKLKTNGDKII